MWSWRLGSIRGIDVKVHATFPLVFLWVAWEFGLNQGVGQVLLGALLVILLFACVLLHELGHALVAQGFRIPVEDITLLPIGGLAKFRMMNDRPLEEFVIAIAGPLVNVVIALLLLPLMVWTTDLLDPALIGRISANSGQSQLWVAVMLLARALQRLSFEGILAYLFVANVMLALFNMLPAFPMDGGRVLRALLAAVLPYPIATVTAVRLGQLLAVGLMLLTLTGNIALLFVGGFIFLAGNAELARVRQREILASGAVGRYMMQGLHPLYPQWNLYSARLVAQQSGQRAFPVMEDQQLRGLLSVREIHNHPPSSTVADAMIVDYAIVAPAGTLYEAQLALQEREQFAAAVMEGGTLLGLLSLEDIERAYHSLQRQPKVRVA